MVPFSRVLYIEREDFMRGSTAQVLPPRTRARGAPALCLLHQMRRRGQGCDSGEVIELRCTVRPRDPRRRSAPDGRKVKATLHWLSAAHALEAEVRLYDRLFSAEDEPTTTPKRANFKSNS